MPEKEKKTFKTDTPAPYNPMTTPPAFSVDPITPEMVQPGILKRLNPPPNEGRGRYQSARKKG